MPTDDSIEVARGLAADGRFREATELLRAAVANDPLNDAPRTALAGMYRDRGYPDQAGRWGATVPGWATDRELRSFARGFDPGVGPERIAAVLKTTADRVPSELMELVRARGRARSGPREKISLGKVAGGAAGFALLTLLLGCVIVFVDAILGIGNPTMSARAVAVSFGLLGALSAALWVVRSVVKRRWQSAVVSLLVAVALGSLACWVIMVLLDLEQ